MFSEAVKNKLSCAAFFFLPGLSYSLVTSRMPAIKESAQIDDLQLGIALFCLGIAGCIGLFFSSRLVRSTNYCRRRLTQYYRTCDRWLRKFFRLISFRLCSHRFWHRSN